MELFWPKWDWYVYFEWDFIWWKVFKKNKEYLVAYHPEQKRWFVRDETSNKVVKNFKVKTDQEFREKFISFFK